MQATVAMLLALGGMGCHHQGCAPSYTPSCYSAVSSPCATSYAPSGYMMPSCYTSAPSCYPMTPAPGCGTTRRGTGLFACFNRKWSACNPCAPLGAMYDASYSMPVYGSYTPSVVVSSGQSWPSSQYGTVQSMSGAATMTTTPAATTPAAPEPPAPVTPPPATGTPPAAPMPAAESAPAPAATAPAVAPPATPTPPAPATDKPKSF